MNRLQYLNEYQHEVKHDTRAIIETGLLILDEAVKDTYEDDGVPMLSRNRVYRATQEEEALTRLLNILQRELPNPSSPTTTPQTPQSVPTALPAQSSTPPTLTQPQWLITTVAQQTAWPSPAPPAQSSTPPTLTSPTAGNINTLPEMATVADTAPMVDHYSGPTESRAKSNTDRQRSRRSISQ